MKVPFCDLSLQYNELRCEINRSWTSLLKRQDFILGRDVEDFENEFARETQTKFAVGTSSGTEALFLSLKALDIQDGDEVIVPDFTFIATAFAVSYTGAKPVFVDIDEKTYNIDPDRIESLISKKTKAIIPVHLFGQPANLKEILYLAKRYNLKIIEDCAQAHGASFQIKPGDWRPVGGLGDLGCFSFYPSKNLGAWGDAGMIVTNNEKIYQKLLLLRDCGRKSKYEHVLIGYNARLDTLQAGILRIKLKKLKEWNLKRQKAADFYTQSLKGLMGITIPYVDKNSQHVYHVYAIQLKNRDKVFNYLQKKGISCLIHYPIPLHLQLAYKHLGYRKGDFPVAESLAKKIISLPIFPHIKTKQQQFVVDRIREAMDIFN